MNSMISNFFSDIKKLEAKTGGTLGNGGGWYEVKGMEAIAATCSDGTYAGGYPKQATVDNYTTFYGTAGLANAQ